MPSTRELQSDYQGNAKQLKLLLYHGKNTGF